MRNTQKKGKFTLSLEYKLCVARTFLPSEDICSAHDSSKQSEHHFFFNNMKVLRAAEAPTLHERC